MITLITKVTPLEISGCVVYTPYSCRYHSEFLRFSCSSLQFVLPAVPDAALG